MNHLAIKFAFAATALLALGTSNTALATQPAGGEKRIKAEMYVEKRQSVKGVSADADAILRALQHDSTLATRLAKNPSGAEAMLRAVGATRAERITVTSDDGGGAQRTTITITITIDDVTITLTIRL